MGWFSSMLTSFFGGSNGSNNLGSSLSTPFQDLGETSRTPWLNNLVKKTTGAGLTNAEMQANQFSHDEAILAHERSLEADSTKYQRSVADMQAAGINPMLAAGGVSSSVASPSPSSVNPSSAVLNVGDILGAIQGFKHLDIEQNVANSEIRKNDADAAKAHADADRIVEDTRGSKLANEFAEKTLEARVEGVNLANRLTRTQTTRLYKEMDVMSTEMTRNIEQAHSEQEKQILYQQQAVLAQAEAWQIAQLVPAQVSELYSRGAEERAMAVQASVAAAYQNGLITGGMVQKAIELADADISLKEADAHYKHIMELVNGKDYTGLAKALGGDSKFRQVDVFCSQFIGPAMESGMKILGSGVLK